MAKKRGQGTGSITQMPNGTYQARIDLGRDEQGKRIRKAKYCKTKKEANAWLMEVLNEVKNDTYIESNNMTVAQWMDIWLKEYKKNSIKPGSYLNYLSQVNYHIKPLLGDIKLQNLRNDMVQRFINTLNDKGLKVKTIKIIHSVLYSALQQAVDNEIIQKNVSAKATLPQKTDHQVIVLSVEEQKKFIEIARRTYHGEIYILILATGLRIGEALALTWDDVDFGEGILRVNKTQVVIKDCDTDNGKYHIEYGTPKTKSSNRIIPLLPDIQQMLKEIYKSQHEKSLEEGKKYKNNLVFSNLKGGALYASDIRKGLKRMLKKEALNEKLHPHCLRHTFATRCLENGIELKVVQELLGHASINMTADLYTHVLPDKKKESIMKLQGTINL